MNSPMQAQANQMSAMQPHGNSGVNMPCNVGQTYSQQNAYPQQVNHMTMQQIPNMQMAYNNFTTNNGICNNSSMVNNGNYVVNQCGHMAPNNGAFANPACSPCNHQNAPVCNMTNNWSQCHNQGYPNNMAPNQNMQPFQANVAWNNQMTPNNMVATQGNQTQMSAGQPMMYNMHMQNPNGVSYNFARAPTYNQLTTAIQCQDVSQSQDSNRVRVQDAVQVQSTQVPGQTAQVTATAAATAAAPGNMRPETYQRTLEYVQQCQSWNTGDGVKVTKENKPPTQAATAGEVARNAEASGRSLLSPGQDAVSSSTDRQDASIAPPMVVTASNMVVHDMNTSLNSLMQENRFLQMIQ